MQQASHTPAPKTAQAPPVYTLVLRAEPGTDPIRNLRALLKAAKRRFGFRALSVVEVPPERAP